MLQNSNVATLKQPVAKRGERQQGYIMLIYSSGSQRLKHGGPPKTDVNIFGAQYTFLTLICIFQTFK
jgi:hypothetical protein